MLIAHGHAHTHHHSEHEGFALGVLHQPETRRTCHALRPNLANRLSNLNLIQTPQDQHPQTTVCSTHNITHPSTSQPPIHPSVHPTRAFNPPRARTRVPHKTVTALSGLPNEKSKATTGDPERTAGVDLPRPASSAAASCILCSESALRSGAFRPRGMRQHARRLPTPSCPTQVGWESVGQLWCNALSWWRGDLGIRA